jgi:Glycosyltransferase family 9 (heptosyltransferase)
MNEELKPGAFSSGFVQGSNKRDEGPDFIMTSSLNNFLIRRQLLAIESKRIQYLLGEAARDLKDKKDNIVTIRDRVLVDLRDHLDHQNELVRMEGLRKKRLDSLPRAAERYIRRRVKRLFSGDNPRASTRIADRSDPLQVDFRDWHLPKIRQLEAWTSWFAETDPTFSKPSRFRKDRIQAALVVTGGIGDLLKSTHLVRAISDHFSCDLTIIMGHRSVGQIVAQNPYVTGTVVSITQTAFGLSDRLSHIPVFDLLVLWKYNVQYVLPVGSRISRDVLRSIESDSSDLRHTLDNYCFGEAWPIFNFAFSRDSARFRLSAMKVSIATSGLRHDVLDEIPFFPSKRALRVVAGLLTKRYVTVHHGFDVNSLPAKTRVTDYRSTKNISLLQWRQIVSLIRKQGVEIIQLGTIDEEKIEGVTHYLNGQTSLEETGLLIKHGLCHIDTEGGLVHLANAVHRRCVVLFGPTPVEFFGYPENINLEPSGCKACWFATQTWHIECPRHTSGPECMAEHSAASVADAANRIVAESENLSAKLIVAETTSSPTPLAKKVASSLSFSSRDPANRTLLIFDDLACDVRSELSDRVLEGSDLILCAAIPPDLEPSDRVRDRLEYGSLLNLARASSSVDTVAWVSRELESDIVPFALREIFRVLKPGGQLVFVAGGESPGLDLRRSLLEARIGFDNDEMPGAPVYSCSLRKAGRQAEGVQPRSGSGISVSSSEMARRDSGAVDPRLMLLEEENIRQITLVRETFAQQEKAIDEARAVVDGAVRGAFGGDGWIWISSHFADGYPTKFFVRGWHSALAWVIWSRENKCLLMLPFDEEKSSRGHDLLLQLHLALPQTSASNPITIGVRVNDGPIEYFHLSTDDEILTVQSSINASRFRGVSLVEFHLGAETSLERERLHGHLGMGVKRFRYRVSSS